MWQISYPPANGASQGNYFLPKSQKLAFFEKRLTKTALAAKVANFFSNGFWFWLEKRSIKQTIYQGVHITYFTERESEPQTSFRPGIVNFIQKNLSKKSYPQISHVKNIIQKFYPNFFLSKILLDFI